MLGLAFFENTRVSGGIVHPHCGNCRQRTAMIGADIVIVSGNRFGASLAEAWQTNCRDGVLTAVRKMSLHRFSCAGQEILSGLTPFVLFRGAL